MFKNTRGALFASGALLIVVMAANVYIDFDNLAMTGLNLAAVGNLRTGDSTQTPFPALNLPSEAKGADIIAALGTSLPEVARWYGISEDEFRQHARDDKSLRADTHGRLYYHDTSRPQAADGVLAQPGSLQPSSIPLEQTFFLHSKAGSNKTIYLDFDGHTFYGGKSAWADNFNGGKTLIAAPMDLDGDASTFSASERKAIQNIWLTMAEDFAPFDVDVTTEAPTEDRLLRSSSSDLVFGTRVLFSQLPVGGAGMAYVGSFDDTSEYYKTALVLPASLWNSDRYMAEAASHEAGHTVGLYHQGTSATEYYNGQGDWAPIMGASYYTNINQWAKGEYANANNKSDAFQAMIANGLSYRLDDRGNDRTSASPITVLNNAFAVEGMIEKNGDVDFYKLNADAGALTVNALPATLAPDLDIELSVYDSNGALLATINPKGLNATTSIPVLAGTYYLSVRGVGWGDPLLTGYTSYGSVGQYSITGTVSASANNSPVAKASATPTSGVPPLTVQFSSAGSADPEGGQLTYLWNLGDNTTSSEANPQKIYANPGTYTATLTVKDPAGLSSSQSVQVWAVNQTPVAIFTMSPSSGYVPVTVSLDASASSDPDGTIASYAWDFGDGATGTGVTASHTYTTGGLFTVKLTVTDSYGATATKLSGLSFTDPGSSSLAAPANLTATSNAKARGQATLIWSDMSDGESGFYIERSSARGVPSYSRVGQVSAGVTSFIDLVASDSYYYRVQAFADGKTSAYSNAVQVRVK